MSKKPILCLDFDGVIHSYTSGWQGKTVIPDDPVPGAIEFLDEAIDHFEVHIYSSRSDNEEARFAMHNYIDKWAKAFYRTVSDTELANKLKFPPYKPPAFLTIDDRAIQFTGVFPTIQFIKEFKPWNK